MDLPTSPQMRVHSLAPMYGRANPGHQTVNPVHQSYTAYLPSPFIFNPSLPQPNLPSPNRPQQNHSQPNLPQQNLPQPNLPQPNNLQSNLPQLNLPQLNLPQLNLPQLNLPQPNLPQLNIPQLNLPQLNLPQLNLPQLNLHQQNLPKLNLPLPNPLPPNLPQLNLPQPNLSQQPPCDSFGYQHHFTPLQPPASQSYQSPRFQSDQPAAVGRPQLQSFRPEMSYSLVPERQKKKRKLSPPDSIKAEVSRTDQCNTSTSINDFNYVSYDAVPYYFQYPPNSQSQTRNVTCVNPKARIPSSASIAGTSSNGDRENAGRLGSTFPPTTSMADDANALLGLRLALPPAPPPAPPVASPPTPILSLLRLRSALPPALPKMNIERICYNDIIFHILSLLDYESVSCSMGVSPTFAKNAQKARTNMKNLLITCSSYTNEFVKSVTTNCRRLKKVRIMHGTTLYTEDIRSIIEACSETIVGVDITDVCSVCVGSRFYGPITFPIACNDFFLSFLSKTIKNLRFIDCRGCFQRKDFAVFAQRYRSLERFACALGDIFHEEIDSNDYLEGLKIILIQNRHLNFLGLRGFVGCGNVLLRGPECLALKTLHLCNCGISLQMEKRLKEKFPNLTEIKCVR